MAWANAKDEAPTNNVVQPTIAVHAIISLIKARSGPVGVDADDEETAGRFLWAKRGLAGAVSLDFSSGWERSCWFAGAFFLSYISSGR